MFLTASSGFQGPAEKPRGPDEPLPMSCYCKQKKKTTKTTSQIRSIALIFFLLACFYWLYKVYTNATGGFGHGSSRAAESRAKLKLISVFNRHGDRSPSDALPTGDEFKENPSFFWPNGLSNLTDLGRFRQLRVGLELRRRYEDFLDYNASHYIAFSSPIYRCQESLDLTLRGLFNIEWPLDRGLKLIDEYNSDIDGNKQCLAAVSGSCTCARNKHLILPSGSGSPLDYQRIKSSSRLLPTLTYAYLNACKFRLENPSPVDSNLSASPAVARLKGIQSLKAILESQYATGWQFDALGLFSTLTSEMRLARTRDTINYGRRNFDWPTKPVPEYSGTGITFLDLYEQVALLSYRDRIVDTADIVQLGPMMTSLIVSQKVALNEEFPKSFGFRYGHFRGFDTPVIYEGKKAVFYSTHDSILQLMLHRLGVIKADEYDFETRFSTWHQADDFDQFRAGLRMSKFGMSLVFELYEMDTDQNKEREVEGTTYAYVQAVLYNKEDGVNQPINYRNLELGKLCIQLFQKQHPDLTDADLETAFYDQDRFPLNRDRSCPFKLFKNVTSSYMMTARRLSNICEL